MQDDFERITVTHARLVSICSADTGPVSEASEAARGAINDQSKYSDTWEEILWVTAHLSKVDQHTLVMQGISASLIRVAIGTYQVLGKVEICQAIGLSSARLRRLRDDRLSSRHSDAALALIEITDMAQRVLGTREIAEAWLNHPAIALDGLKPLTMLKTTPGIEAVKELLARMEYGVCH